MSKGKKILGEVKSEKVFANYLGFYLSRNQWFLLFALGGCWTSTDENGFVFNLLSDRKEYEVYAGISLMSTIPMSLSPQPIKANRLPKSRKTVFGAFILYL